MCKQMHEAIHTTNKQDCISVLWTLYLDHTLDLTSGPGVLHCNMYFALVCLCLALGFVDNTRLKTWTCIHLVRYYRF